MRRSFFNRANRHIICHLKSESSTQDSVPSAFSKLAAHRTRRTDLTSPSRYRSGCRAPEPKQTHSAAILGRIILSGLLAATFWASYSIPAVPQEANSASVQKGGDGQQLTLDLLASPEPANRAWGAYFVGQYDQRELVPQLWQTFDGGLDNST